MWSTPSELLLRELRGLPQKGGATGDDLDPLAQAEERRLQRLAGCDGNLIPIYDPATLRVLEDGTVVKDPFAGNIIPASRITPEAQQFMQFLPQPTSDGPLNNYLVPTAIPDTILGDSNYYFFRFDTYVGQQDHMSISLWHQRAPAKFYSTLPHELANETIPTRRTHVNRFNWDHTFGPNILNHFAFGYLNRNEGYGSINQDAVDQLPQIVGVAAHNTPPTLNFSDGSPSGVSPSGPNQGNLGTRPTYSSTTC